MTETIIRWAVNVVLLALAFIWGYREGQVKGYTYYIEQSKKIEDNLLNIINQKSPCPSCKQWLPHIYQEGGAE